MGTAVFFHAHPDDEAISTAGTMAKLSSEGHRVVLVVATRGEHGEVPEGFLDPGEALWERRVRETHAAAEALGVHRVEFLGYVDSGMMGTPENDKEGSFWTADLDEAAGRLAAVLAEERADALTIYDDNGGYGHPDHIQVHRVGVLAAERAGVPRVYETAFDRDHMRAVFERAREMGQVPAGAEERAQEAERDPDAFGTPSELITTRVDAAAFVERKRAAMAAHASQISETSFFLAMPDELFALVWGTECFVRRGAPPGTSETSLLEPRA